jgi:HlyD family secretion protein
MTRRTRLLLAAVAIAVVALLAWAFAPRPLEIDAGVAARAPFETTIEEEGRTRLRDRYVVAAPVGGVVDRIALRAGDAVAEGQVVATLHPLPPAMLDARSRLQAEAGVDAAQAQVVAADARVARARVAFSQAGDQLKRTESLRAQGFVSPVQVEDARHAASAAAHDVEAAAAERVAARGALEQARAAAQHVGEGGGAVQGATPVRAPVAGRVTRVVQASAGPVLPGAALVEIGDTRAIEVVAELLTADAIQARPGSPVRLTNWGGEGVLQARVRAVEPSAFTKVSALGVEEQRVNVLVDLTSPSTAWGALGDGFRVELAIQTFAQADALVVPVGAVFPLSAARDGMAVFVVDGTHARLKHVDVGGRNGKEAWIRAGLKAGDAVVLYPPVTLQDGQRVKVRR